MKKAEEGWSKERGEGGGERMAGQLREEEGGGVGLTLAGEGGVVDGGGLFR